MSTALTALAAERDKAIKERVRLTENLIRMRQGVESYEIQQKLLDQEIDDLDQAIVAVQAVEASTA